MIKPPCLQRGMTIGLVAPASAVKDVTVIDRATEQLKKQGYKVTEGKSIRKRLGYLAASDRERVSDLHQMFSSKRIDAIMCVRGGYGTPRIMPLLDMQLIRDNPKIFVGFSDITLLHLAMMRRAGLVTFNGPMLAFTFGEAEPNPFTVASFERVLTKAEPAGNVWQGHSDKEFRVVRTGRATGPLTGGNLSLVAASLGTPDEIETRGRIVFLEEVDEKPYRIDRMLSQMLNAGKLWDSAAVVFGRNVPDEETAEMQKKRPNQGRHASPFPKTVDREWEPDIDDVIADRLKPLGIPVLIGLPFGHISEYTTLPLGIRATVDARSGDLVIEESAVS